MDLLPFESAFKFCGAFRGFPREIRAGKICLDANRILDCPSVLAMYMQSSGTVMYQSRPQTKRPKVSMLPFKPQAFYDSLALFYRDLIS
jgi:hypothetical protein